MVFTLGPQEYLAMSRDPLRVITVEGVVTAFWRVESKDVAANG